MTVAQFNKFVKSNRWEHIQQDFSESLRYKDTSDDYDEPGDTVYGSVEITSSFDDVTIIYIEDYTYHTSDPYDTLEEGSEEFILEGVRIFDADLNELDEQAISYICREALYRTKFTDVDRFEIVFEEEE